MVDLLIPGPEGKIEAKYSHNNKDDSPIVILLHPDPTKGGTMHTKIIFKMYKIFIKAGFSTIRFNFRGVGKSEGTYDQGVGELADATSALDFLQSNVPNARACWVVGFSFGAWIGMQILMRRPEVTGFIAVSPPANTYDFSFLAPCPSSGLIINGENDRVVPSTKVSELVDKLQHQKGITISHEIIKKANHFFDPGMEEMLNLTKNYVQRRLLENTR